jgi:hypothetical protein
MTGHFQWMWVICALAFCVALHGCGAGANMFTSSPQNLGNSSVVLAITDMSPSLVSILSAEVTLTGATLTPGNVSLFSGSTTVELTRLQTDVAYLTTASNIPTGTYTSLVLTFANPSLTIENDMAGPIAGCAVGAVCTITPIVSSMSKTAPLSSFSIVASSTTGLLIDVNLENLLNSSLTEDFSGGINVFPFVPGGIGAPPVGAEDVVGHVASVSLAKNGFTLTNAEASYVLKVDSSTTFLFSSGTSCAIVGFTCLENSEILSVDIGIEPDGSIVARNILFEDADSSDAEVEGSVTSIDAASEQFDMVIHTISSSGTGLSIGQKVTVRHSASPPTPFDIDIVHADGAPISTSSFSFAGPSDLVVGQGVSIRLHGIQSGGELLADRVRLRSSRITGTVRSVASSVITLVDLPSLFTSHGGVSQILALTSVTPPTIYFQVNGSINSATNITNQTVAVRGPLFDTSGTNRNQVTTKVVLK